MKFKHPDITTMRKEAMKNWLSGRGLSKKVVKKMNKNACKDCIIWICGKESAQYKSFQTIGKEIVAPSTQHLTYNHPIQPDLVIIMYPKEFQPHRLCSFE